MDLLGPLHSGNGPTGASPFSPITPVAIDPSIPRDITIYVQQYQNPGPISAKYGTQVGNQCLLQLDRDLLPTQKICPKLGIKYSAKKICPKFSPKIIL